VEARDALEESIAIHYVVNWRLPAARGGNAGVDGSGTCTRPDILAADVGRLLSPTG
jgi:hypothetical protein